MQNCWCTFHFPKLSKNDSPSSLENHEHQEKMVLCRQWKNIYRIIKLRATSLSLWFFCILAVLDLLCTKIINIPEESKVFNLSNEHSYSTKKTKLFPGISFFLLRKGRGIEWLFFIRCYMEYAHVNILNKLVL